MCLAIPLQITRLVDANRAVVQQANTDLEVDTTLLDTAEVGDYVIVHAGFAIEKLDNDEAGERLAMFEELLPRTD